MDPWAIALVVLFLLFGSWGVHEWTDGDGSSNNSSQMCSPH